MHKEKRSGGTAADKCASENPATEGPGAEPSCLSLAPALPTLLARGVLVPDCTFFYLKHFYSLIPLVLLSQRLTRKSVQDQNARDSKFVQVM